MRKYLLALLLFISCLLKPSAAYAENQCKITLSIIPSSVTPIPETISITPIPNTSLSSPVFSGITRLHIEGEGTFEPNVKNLLIQLAERVTLTRSGQQEWKNSGQAFSVNIQDDNTFEAYDVGPFFSEGEYRIDAELKNGNQIKTLCSSEPPFTVYKSAVPIPECNPPGIDSKGVCKDPRCVATGGVRGGSPCQLRPLTIPTDEPTPTPTPPETLSPCAEWVYSFPTDAPDFSEKNGKAIPQDSRDHSDPKFKNRKCAAVNTGLGEIRTEPAGFVTRILGLLLSVSGGIAIILIIVSGYRFMVSQGNPEALQAARDQLVSAIVGLLFIIFSLVILQVIGVDILHIPGFG